MFCTNCGKDCGKYNFCPYCGTKMQLESDQQSQQPAEEKEPYEIPYGTYGSSSSSLSLYETRCVIKNTVFFKHYETKIPYEQIRRVIYVRSPHNAFTSNFFLIRYDGNKDDPISEDNNFVNDKTAISIEKSADGIFTYFYYMFMALAPDTAEFRMVTPAVNMPELTDLAANTDLDWYFEEYAPYRHLAVEAMCRRTGATLLGATELVNRVFDARQEKIYAKDPMAAIRDLNLVLEKKKQEDAQHKEEEEKKAIRKSLERLETWAWLDSMDSRDD